MVLDLITGQTVRLNEKEAIRQEEERKLLEELGYEAADAKDLIRLNLSLKPSQGKAKQFPLVVLRQPRPARRRPGPARLYPVRHPAQEEGRRHQGRCRGPGRGPARHRSRGVCCLDQRHRPGCLVEAARRHQVPHPLRQRHPPLR